MSFTAKDVAELRKMTGAGMMQCKEALTECNGDIDEAVNLLRKKGIAGAAKKAGKVAAEGILALARSEDGKQAAIVEVNCQTDFVAQNQDFVDFAKVTAKLALENKVNDAAALLDADLDGKKLSEVVLEKIATIGEKIDVRRVSFVQSEGFVGAYIHPVGSKIGSLVAVDSNGSAEVASDIAMHIAASNPVPEFVTADDVPSDAIAAETKIEMEKEDLQGKPEEIKEKIVSGRVNKLIASKTLSEQPFIKNPDQKVKDYIGSAKILSFNCLKVGEGVEKKDDDFAGEVAAMMNS